MKKLLLAVVIVGLIVAISAPSNAQSKMSLSVGGDVMLPLGTFGDEFSLGFGGTVRGQYDFTPVISAGLEAGYFSWSAKSVTAPAVAPTIHGVPVRVFGKYYFMPEGAKMRFYGMAELGLFFGSSSVTVPSFTFLGVTYGGTTSASSTDFMYAPVVGVEIPAGKVAIDVSVRYDGIATSGSSTSNIGARVGVNFPL
jgi:Outer membrane protein beta-barrel domain